MVFWADFELATLQKTAFLWQNTGNCGATVVQKR
jgi:hypothetical protein